MNTAHYFIRSAFFVPLHNNLSQTLQIDPEFCARVLPESVFKNPSTLIPYPEITRWYEAVEKQCKDPDYMLKLRPFISVSNLHWFRQWVLSSHDSLQALLRFNCGMGHMQSGASFYSTHMGNRNLLSWVQDNHALVGRARFHDSVFHALLMYDFLQQSTSNKFDLMMVRISGSTHSPDQYQNVFDCEIEWNSPTTELRFRTSDLIAQTDRWPVASRKVEGISSLDFLDELLDLPQAHDEVKVLYALIHYSQHFGLPSINHVAAILDVSPQTLQRRLQSNGFTFTELSSYVMLQLAVEALIAGKTPEQIARELGYSHVGSFTRHFKRYRGMTPLQFQQWYKIHQH